MSATALILVALPCILVILDDIKQGMYYLWHGRFKTPEAVPLLDALRE